MVCKSPPGSRSQSDFRSLAEDGSDSKRPAVKGDPRLPCIGSGESALSDSTTDSLRRMWSAVLVRALRDYCSKDARMSSGVSRWIRTPDFSLICDWAAVDSTKLREVFDALSLLNPRVRGELVRQISISRFETKR